MRTELPSDFADTPTGQRANEILRACVHCGFCNATCPTYQLSGNELDGPRGRIYLIKELLESGGDSNRAQQHLDRCLTCRACETTCPSGVAYGELAEIARDRIGPNRSGIEGWMRRGLRWIVPYPSRLRTLLWMAKLVRPLLPKPLRQQLPKQVGRAAKGTVLRKLSNDPRRKVLLLNGCAQQVMTPQTNKHLVGLLERHGIATIVANKEGCCGSLDLHLGADAAAQETMRRNVDALSVYLDDVDAIVSTASGCGVTLKDYGRLLRDDPNYSESAQALAAKVCDVGEYLFAQQLTLEPTQPGRKLAWHAPCTLQHGQQVDGAAERLLRRSGYELVSVVDPHLCCGSAGTYSILHSEWSEQLRDSKLAALCANQPDLIATANVGCQTHLDAGADIPVKHWIELVR